MRRKASRLPACLDLLTVNQEIVPDLRLLLNSAVSVDEIGKEMALETEAYRSRMARLRTKRAFAEEVSLLTPAEKALLGSALAEIAEARG